jgi:F-type H+-transporting ATPase subunit delta
VRVSTGSGRMAVTGHDQGVARRYARAALDVARGQGGTAAEAAHQELDALARLLERDDAIRGLLLDRGLPPEARRRAASAVAAAARLSPLVHKLLEMLAAHDRLALVPALAQAYGVAWNAEQGIVTAEAVSAAPLEPEQLTALSSALGVALGAPVDLRARVDPAVLGGVVVNAAGRTYDGTVRGRLSALRRRLAATS